MPRESEECFFFHTIACFPLRFHRPRSPLPRRHTHPMADAAAARAAELVKKADKRLTSFSLFGGNKYEDAAELLEKAANQYKLAKCCEWRGREVEGGGEGGAAVLWGDGGLPIAREWRTGALRDPRGLFCVALTRLAWGSMRTPLLA